MFDKQFEFKLASAVEPLDHIHAAAEALGMLERMADSLTNRLEAAEMDRAAMKSNYIAEGIAAVRESLNKASSVYVTERLGLAAQSDMNMLRLGLAMAGQNPRMFDGDTA